jgi:ADP-heptose:LPS heptosyltransferase
MEIKHLLRFSRDWVRRIFGILLFDIALEPATLPISNLKHIVFIRWDAKWGDAIISSFVFEHLRKTYPEVKISVVTSVAMSDYFRNYVDVNKRLKILAEQLGVVDLLVHFSFMKMKDLYFLSKVQALNVAGLDDEIQRVNIKLGRDTQGKHFAQKFVVLLEYLGIEAVTPKYQVPLNIKAVAKSERFLAMKGERSLLVINPYGSSKKRKLNTLTTKKIIIEALKLRPNINIAILSTPETISEVHELCLNLDRTNVFYYPECRTIYDAIALVSKAEWVISVDTAIVHIASGLKKPLLALYSPDKKNYSDWHPNSNKASTCFAKKVSPLDINALNWTQLFASLSELLQL